MKISHNISALLRKTAVAAMLASVGVAFAQPRLEMSLGTDSLLMGKVTTIDLRLTGSPDADGAVMAIAELFAQQGIEFYDDTQNIQVLERIGGTDTAPVFGAQYKIQAFDSGAYVIPPFAYIKDTDTIFSNPAVLNVVPVDVSELTDINPADIEPEAMKVDFLPDWLIDYWLYILIGLLVIAAGIAAYFIFVKKSVVIRLRKPKPVEPPYDEAMRCLRELREEHLWEKGMDKSYYTRLTDILRVYLQRRFGINAMEMTSSQIIKAIFDREDISRFNEIIRPLMQTSDMVKFAKARPEGSDNIRAFDSVTTFVEETRPEEAPKEDESNPESTDTTDTTLPISNEN